MIHKTVNEIIIRIESICKIKLKRKKGILNGKRNVIFKCSKTLWKKKHHKCCQHVQIPFSCDRAGFEPSWSHLLKKIRPNDECYGETAPYHNLCKEQGLLMDTTQVFPLSKCGSCTYSLDHSGENGPHLSKGCSTTKQH